MKIFSSCLAITLGILFVSCNNDGSSRSPGENAAEGWGEWKTGIALFSFHRHPFTTAISMADSAGVKFVEGFSFYKLGKDFSDSTMGNLDAHGLEKMKQVLAEKNIQMTSMYVEGAKDVNDWKRFFEMGKLFGMKYLVCEPDKAHLDLIDSLAGEYQIKIAIHEHAKGISAYWHPDSVVAAMQGRENIGACADLGHWARSGLDVVECLKKLDGRIFGLHIKDVERLGDPKAGDVNPGKGVIDYPGVFAELKRQKFDGYAQIECEHSLDNNLSDIKETIEFLKK